MRNSTYLKFVVADDDNHGCFSDGEKKYIGTAFFDIVNDFDMADGDPTKFPSRDSQNNENALYKKVYDEEVDLYNMQVKVGPNKGSIDDEDFDVTNKDFEGEISVVIKISWEDGHEQRWAKIRRMQKLEAKEKKEAVDDEY